MKPQNLATSRGRPRAGSASGGREPLDPSPLVGTWINTNPASTGITKALVTLDNGGLRLRVFAAGESEPYDWGDVKVEAVFADSMDSDSAISFIANYDFGFLQTELQTNLAQGLLIITSLNVFKDGSCRSNYFAREFFYKQPAV